MENTNKSLGAVTKDTSSMRDGNIERRVGIETLNRMHSRRIKLGLAEEGSNACDFLFEKNVKKVNSQVNIHSS